MEQKKKIIAAVLLVLTILTIGGVYYYFTNYNSTGTSVEKKPLDIESNEFTKKQDWDTVANKADMIERLNEVEQKKAENINNFDASVNEKNKVNYDDGIKYGGNNKKNSHSSSLEKRLREEVAKDQPIDNKSQKIAVVNNHENESDPDFQFGGFTINKNKQKSVQPATANDYNQQKIPENLLPQSPQAVGVVNEKTKIYTNAALKITLTTDLQLQAAGIVVPKGTVITAITNLSGVRVTGRITGINFKGQIHKVYLNLYDNDGNEGLQVDGIKKDLNANVRGGIDNVISSSGSALGAGGQLLGGIVSSVNRNKNKTEAVIPQGYQVLIRE